MDEERQLTLALAFDARDWLPSGRWPLGVPSGAQSCTRGPLDPSLRDSCCHACPGARTAAHQAGRPEASQRRRECGAQLAQQWGAALELNTPCPVWPTSTHRSAFPRTSPGLRLTLSTLYSRMYMRPQERYDEIIGEGVLARNPPRFRTLISQIMRTLAPGWRPWGPCKDAPAGQGRRSSPAWPTSSTVRRR